MNYLRFFLVAVLYLISGVVILKCLSKLKMHIASGAFIFLFFVGSLYIPIVCGTGVMRSLLLHTLTGRFDVNTFVDGITSPTYYFVPYFSVVTLLFFVFAVILLIALLIVAVLLVRHIVRIFRRATNRGFRHRAVVRIPRPYTPKNRKIYLEFCRLLN